MRSIQECFAAEYNLREMSGNHLDQILETPIYHYHQPPTNPLRPCLLKDMYGTVFLPNVKKEGSRAKIVSVVFDGHCDKDGKFWEDLAAQLQTEFMAELAKLEGLNVTVEKASVRENDNSAPVEIWLKLKSSIKDGKDDSWHQRVLRVASHLKNELERIVSTEFPGPKPQIHVFSEPDEREYGVAILFRKDKFDTVEIPSALKRWSFMARLDPLLSDDEKYPDDATNYRNLNASSASCAAITILQNKSDLKQRMCVVTTHLASKYQCPTFQLAQFSALIHDLETHLGDIPIVVCGDFNSNRESIVSLYAANQGFPEVFPEELPWPPLKKSDENATPKTELAAWAKQFAHEGTENKGLPVSTSFFGGEDKRDNFPVEKVWHAPPGLPAAAASGSCDKLPWRLRRHWVHANLFCVTNPAR